MSKAQEIAKLHKEHGRSMSIRSFDIQSPAHDIDLSQYYSNILPEDEIDRAVEQYNNEYEELNREFSEKTHLNAADCAFLVLATALQCLRQYLLTSFKPTIDEKATAEADKQKFAGITSKLDDKGYTGNQGGYYFAKFDTICHTTHVPYDTIKGSKKFKLGLGGLTHRYKTLGHDPILGYFFGTMNILTNTLTTSSGLSYHIRDNRIYSHASTAIAADKMLQRIKTDTSSVAAALAKQCIHIKSDMYTPNHIPFPCISTISSELSMTLAEYGISCANIINVGKQASYSIIINTLISMLHRLLLINDKEENKNLFEVRTRKILLYSNVIASSSNVLYCGLTNDFKKLDIGGFAVTIYRLFSDLRFIEKIKYEFINTKLNEKYDKEFEEISMYYS